MTVIDEAPEPKAILLRSLLRHGINSSHTLCVAYSGGADSTALLKAACEVRDTAGSPLFGVTLLALYLDHGIRSEAERAAEREVVQRVCKELGVRLVAKHLEPGFLKQEARKGGVEAAAREARYSFFAESVCASSAELVLTAHHLDDQLETILLQFLRGGGPGAAGMSEIRDIGGVRVLRPWLKLPGTQLRGYTQKHRLTHVTDSSNSDTEFARNRVRHRLIPVLDELFPEYRSTLLSADERQRMLAEFLSQEAERRIEWAPYGSGWCASRESFFAAPAVIRVESLKRVCVKTGEAHLSSLSGAPGLPSSGFFSQISGIDDGKPVGPVAAGGGWLLQRFHDLILWGPDIVLTGKNGYVLRVRENMRVVLGPDVCPVVSTTENGQAEPASEIQLDATTLAAPLLLRTRRPGDAIQTGAGSKSVKKLLSEWRIPSYLREGIPVLEDRNGLCAVVGAPFGYRNLVSRRCSLHQNEQEREMRAANSSAETSIFRLWVTADGVENEYAK